jgi:S-adenosylmethionine:tRNA ribosyltransferase-isomerase
VLTTADFDYDLPPELIAQQPLEPRDASRLLVLQRATGQIEHAAFRDLPRLLRRGDLLVLNNTRVIPARLAARKPTGGKVELLLLERHGPRTWQVLVGGQGLAPGSVVELEAQPGLRAVVLEVHAGAQRLVQFSEPISPRLEQIGQVPLPPYIHEPLADRERYQTVYAQVLGSAAAPTAGLHFTPELLAELEAAGIGREHVTLHVGLDTFLPVSEADASQHAMHGEWCELSRGAAARINAARAAGGRIVAVGTTSVRTLETAAAAAEPGQAVGAVAQSTHLFIRPGHHWRAVDAMITNFHLPRSTLLMLVSALAGRERILAAYEEAKRQSYRFYSFGDAMLIL